MSYGSENRKPDASLLQYGFVEARATAPLRHRPSLWRAQRDGRSSVVPPQEREPPVLALVDQVGYSQRAPWVDTELYAETLYVRGDTRTSHSHCGLGCW